MQSIDKLTFCFCSEAYEFFDGLIVQLKDFYTNPNTKVSYDNMWETSKGVSLYLLPILKRFEEHDDLENEQLNDGLLKRDFVPNVHAKKGDQKVLESGKKEIEFLSALLELLR